MIKAIITVHSMLISVLVSAQTDFSGNWVLKGQSAVSGKQYVNGSPKHISIMQQPASIVITKISDVPGGREFIVKEVIGFDGKAVETSSAQHKIKTMVIRWNAAGTAFKETTVIAEPDDTTKILSTTMDTYFMDGALLVLDRAVVNNASQVEWETKSMYAKQ